MNRNQNEKKNCRNLDQDLHGVRSILKVMQRFPLHSRVNIEMYSYHYTYNYYWFNAAATAYSVRLLFFLSHTQHTQRL